MNKKEECTLKFYLLNRENLPLLILLVVLFVAVLSLSPVLKGEFINWDDDRYITESPLVRSLSAANIKEIFSHPVNLVYAPLTTMSFALENQLGGLHPFGVHLNNLILHLISTNLIFFLGLGLGLSPFGAGVAALIFAVHPMHVESVAWASERKDVLCAVFYLLALHQYDRYLRRPSYRSYGLAFISGLLSMLAKPMAFSLPLIFFLMDWFTGRKLSAKIFVEKIPHFLYIIPLIYMTYAMHQRSIDFNGESWLIGVWSATFYIKQFFFPATLLPVYRLPEPTAIFNLHYVTALVVLAAIFLLLLRFYRDRWLLLAFVWYLVSIFVFFRFDDIMKWGNLSLVADRFMYLPSVGICFWLGRSVERIKEISTGRDEILKPVYYSAVILFLIVISFKTHFQSRIWHSSLTLWDHVIRHDPQNAIAYNNRGMNYRLAGKYDLAFNDYNKALDLDPNYPEAYTNRGNVYAYIRKYGHAVADYTRAIEAASPPLSQPYRNRAIVYFASGKLSAALDDFNKALLLDPTDKIARDYREAVLNKKQNMIGQE